MLQGTLLRWEGMWESEGGGTAGIKGSDWGNGKSVRRLTCVRKEGNTGQRRVKETLKNPELR